MFPLLYLNRVKDEFKKYVYHYQLDIKSDKEFHIYRAIWVWCVKIYSIYPVVRLASMALAGYFYLSPNDLFISFTSCPTELTKFDSFFFFLTKCLSQYICDFWYTEYKMKTQIQKQKQK